MYIKTNEVGEDGNRADTSFFREIPFIDIKTFEKWKADGWYAKDKNHVYIDHSMTDGRHIWALEEADAQSFKAIGYRWGTDKNHVFENGIILNGLNPDSMVVLCPETTAYKEVFFSMVKDSKHVFWGHDEMSGTDPGSFNCKCTPSKDGTFPGAVSYYDKNWIYNENYFPNMDLKDRTKK